MNSSISRATIRNKNKKQKIVVLAIASANQISYAKVVGAWNGNLSGWYQAW